MSKPKRQISPQRQKGSRRRSKQGRRPSFDVDWATVKWSGIDQAFVAFEAESLISLFSAAADSPGCGHRLPSLAVLWSRAVTHPPHGLKEASPLDLSKLLVLARKAAPQLRYLEDCWNADPRLVVRHPIGHDRLRIHPGAYTDPSQLARVVASTAAAIDPLVLDRHGFSLSDLLDAALRYSDSRIGQLSPTWPAEPLPRDESEPNDESLQQRVHRIARTPVALTQEEVDAVRTSSPSSEEWLSCCAQPDRAAVAWKWATVTGDELNICLAPTAEMFGKAVTVQNEHHHRPVPASLVLSGLAASTALLAAEAADDPTSLPCLADCDRVPCH